MKRTLEDLLGEPTETDKAVAAIEARARKHGDHDGHTMNARAFAQRFAGRLLFVPERNAWFQYDGVVWAPIEAGVIMQGWAAEREREALADYLDTANDQTKFALKHARQLLHSMDHQRKTLQAASQLPSMRRPFAAFDQNPWLLAVGNGVLDLRRGGLIPARPDQYLMRRTPVPFDPTATCATFMRFLETVLPDPAMRAFVQRLFGYTLSGDVSEERFFLAHGEGANGKSVLLGILQALLGPFAVSIPSAHLMADKFSKDPEQIHARLVGARLALSNEVREGSVWNESLLKELAGYDKASARELYKGAVDYQPTAKLWIRANSIPGSFDTSDGLSRRYTPLAFNVTIPEAERDHGLLARIVDHELSGVLNWAVAGARKWAQDRDLGLDGLRVPMSVKAEQLAYKHESDWFGHWLEECCDLHDAGAETPTSKLFDSYRSFCIEGNIAAPSLIVFGRTMTKRKFIRYPAVRKQPPRYRGIRLLSRQTEHFGGGDVR